MTPGRRGSLRAAPLAVPLLLGLGLGGCGDDGGADTGGGDSSAPTADPSSSPTTGSGDRPLPTVAPPPRPEVTFEASITPEAGALAVRFSLRNDGDLPLIVVNGADEAGDAPSNPNAPLYAVRGEEDGTVQLASRTFPMLAEREIYTAFTLPVTRAEPGATVEDVYRVPLPLVGRHPYQEVTDQAPLGQAERVEFCLGVLPEPEATTLAEGDDGRLALEHIGEPAESVLCSDPVELP